LEEQRLYYERLLARVEEGESRQLLNAHEHERKQLRKANATLAEKTKKLEEELTFVRSVELIRLPCHFKSTPTDALRALLCTGSSTSR
jgi:hypothetical protein